MLAPDERAVLRNELRPPPGGELELAVATTFTLDLTAALVAPLAFAAFDLAHTPDPVAVLEAVRSAADRIDIFCQAGQVRVPSKPSDLMAFLEPMLHEVRAPQPGYLFHPKLWLLRYRVGDDAVFRLLCGTRNLTNDVSWDALVRLDGTPAGGRPRAENGPLVEFARALPGLVVHELSADRRDRITELAEQLARVEWERPPGILGVAFHALGLRRRRSAPLIEAFAGRRQLVVSPFLDHEALGNIIELGGEVTVVSRPEALERLDPDTLGELSCHVLSPLAGLGDTEDEGITNEDLAGSTLLGGLHAKAYVCEYGRQARMFIGSANATGAGLRERNVEFVVELLAGRALMGVDQFLGPDAGFASLLEEYQATGGESEPPLETVGRQLENLLHRLADQRFVAIAHGHESNYGISLTSSTPGEWPDDVSIRVGLLTVPGTAVEATSGAPFEFEFSDLELADVTPFVVIRARSDELGAPVERATVVRAQLIHDPPGRLDEVIARQVDTPEKFLRFLALLLGLDAAAPMVAREGGSGCAWDAIAGSTGLFEMLVRAIADRPEVLADLDRLVSRLEATEKGRAVLPEGFEELWATMRSAHQALAPAAR
ncbi:MAG: phospholipase D family protein [Actinobacteria bacterium]|nr:phospholipase D family protein [Actinomycetota bacterium]